MRTSRLVLSLAVIALLSGCKMSGSGKGSKPGWQIFKTEHPLSVPHSPIRSGPIELRISKVFLEESKTILAPMYWKALIRGSIVSSEALPLSALDDAFTITGKSGTVYPAHVSTVGPGRRTWQHQEHTGQPTHLPPGVAGELEVWAQVGDDKAHDGLTAFTFHGIHVPLGR